MPSPSPVDEATLAAIFALESVPQMGPGKFRDLFRAGIRPMEVVSGRAELPGSGKRIIQLRDAIRRLDKEAHRDAEQRASRQLAASQRYGAAILTYESHLYPQILLGGNYPIPALFARGDVNVLSARHSVACVGSRHIREPYVRRQEDFARYASSRRFTVVSGFALGADTVAHVAAHSGGGSTIAVMAGGLDRPFPPENKPLWETFLAAGRAVFVSESGFGARASALTLRRRNKLIVALAQGVLVGQSSTSGGAMNAYRFGLEQHKPVTTFEPDGADDTSGNAVIANDARSGGSFFPVGSSAPDLYEAWLRPLSSST